LLLAISLAAFMASLDVTIVNIALPTLSQYFDASASMVSWVTTAYLIVLASFLLIFGKLSDKFGYKKIFLTGFFVFALGSFLCGLSSTLTFLIFSRMLQAVGGAMISAIAPAMVSTYFPAERRGKAMGYITVVGSLGVALGPTLGGFLTQYASWHWIFFINVPVGIFAILLGIKVIPDTRIISTKNLPFDRAGSFLIFLIIASGIFALSMGVQLGFNSPQVIGAAVLCLLAIPVFIRHEKRVADPLLDTSLFKDRDFTFKNTVALLMMLAFGGANFILPFYLELVKGLDTSVAGLFMTVPSVTMMISGILAGNLYNKAGGKKLCLYAIAISLLGYLMLAQFGADTTQIFIIITLGLFGFGLGFSISPNSNDIMNMTKRESKGIVSSILAAERNLGMTIGVALFQLAFVSSMTKFATKHAITEASPVDLKLEVLIHGFDGTFFLAAIVIGICFVLMFLTKETESCFGEV